MEFRLHGCAQHHVLPPSCHTSGPESTMWDPDSAPHSFFLDAAGSLRLRPMLPPANHTHTLTLKESHNKCASSAHSCSPGGNAVATSSSAPGIVMENKSGIVGLLAPRPLPGSPNVPHHLGQTTGQRTADHTTSGQIATTIVPQASREVFTFFLRDTRRKISANTVSKSPRETRITSLSKNIVSRWNGSIVHQNASPFRERLCKSPRTGEIRAPLPHPRQLALVRRNARHMARRGLCTLPKG